MKDSSQELERDNPQKQNGSTPNKSFFQALSDFDSSRVAKLYPFKEICHFHTYLESVKQQEEFERNACKVEPTRKCERNACKVEPTIYFTFSFDTNKQ